MKPGAKSISTTKNSCMSGSEGPRGVQFPVCYTLSSIRFCSSESLESPSVRGGLDEHDPSTCLPLSSADPTGAAPDSNPTVSLLGTCPGALSKSLPTEIHSLRDYRDFTKKMM